jgi:hypothetical protein
MQKITSLNLFKIIRMMILFHFLEDLHQTWNSFWVLKIPNPQYFEISTLGPPLTLLSLLRISIFCHFGSSSFVLPIRPKNSKYS